MANESIRKIEIPLSNDPLTNLQRKAVISEFYIGFGLSNSGEMRISGQFINIYYQVLTLDLFGDPLPDQSIKEEISIKQGTEDFDNWYSVFDVEFISKLTTELEKIV